MQKSKTSMALVIALLAAIYSFSDAYSKEPVWRLDDKSAPRAASLRIMMQKFIAYSYPEFYKLSPDGWWVVDTIGSINGHLIVDIYYKSKRQYLPDTSKTYDYTASKSIAIEADTGTYRLIYLLHEQFMGLTFMPSKIVKIDNRDVLYTVSIYSGTGNYREEKYWVWDYTHDFPVELDHQKAINYAFEQVMPPGHGVWKGGRFDIESLSFKSFTWRDGDGNCCPTGGTIKIDFCIMNNQLEVEMATFNYSDLEERAPYFHREKGDTLYAKNPMVIFKRNQSSDQTEEVHTGDLRQE
jgi:hypothetical protein